MQKQLQLPKAYVGKKASNNSQSLETHKLAAKGTLICTLALFIVMLISTNGIERRAAVLNNLATAQIGFYHQANATKQLFTGEYIDETVTIPGVTILDKLGHSFLSGQLSIKQRDACIIQDYAKRCNFPLLQVPLGMALSLITLILTLTLRQVLKQKHQTKNLITLIGSSLSFFLFLTGIAFGTSINDSPIRNLQRARVGLYVQQDIFKETSGRLSFVRPASAEVRRGWRSGNPTRLKSFVFYDGSVLLELPLLAALTIGLTIILGLFAVYTRV